MRSQGSYKLDGGFVGVVAWVLVAVAASWLICAVGVAAADGQPERAEPVEGQGMHRGIRLIESSESRILFEVDVPEHSLSTHTASTETYDVVSIPGWGLIQEEGVPQLPTRGIMVGIPEGADIELRVLEATADEAGLFRILPVPKSVLLYKPGYEFAQWTVPPRFEERFVASPTVYGTDAFFPSQVAGLDEVGYLRSQRFVTVRLYPIQFNPVTGKLRTHTRLRIELALSFPAGLKRSQLPAPVLESPAYERIYEDQLLNYASARAWRVEPARQAIDATWPLTTTAYKISVAQDGIYQLTYHDLEQAGLQMETVDPQTIQVFSMGDELAVRVVGEEDGEFNSSDYILFYGQGIENKYADRNVYWLVQGQEPGRRMPTRDGVASDPVSASTVFSAQVDLEEDVRYMSLWPGDDSTDRWFWQPLISPHPTRTHHTVGFNLGQVSTGALSAELRVALKGQTAISSVDPDHHATFYVNDEYIGEHKWDGMDTVQVVEIGFDPSILKSGANTIRTTLPGVPSVAHELVYLDRYELEYGRAYWADSNQLGFSQTSAGGWRYEIGGFSRSDIEVYDISEPLTVTQILSLEVESVPAYTVRFSDAVSSTRNYLALTPDRWLSPEGVSLDTPSDLKDAANGADYIVISHADFLPAADRLASHRTGQGLRTVVADVEDVYDEFGYGLPLPSAIRDFVQYAYENWQSPAPTYLVLLGDGTYDPKNNLDLGVDNYLTPYLADVDYWMGETVTDNWFVDVVADPKHLPDLSLGRMPANTLAEANIMVSKTISYELPVPEADWTGRLVFVADRQPDPKWAGNFHDLSEAVIRDSVPPVSSDVVRLYRGEIPSATCASGLECQENLVEAINDGALVVNYIGHGAVNQWGSRFFGQPIDDPEYIWGLDSIEHLSNADRLPVILPMTCLEGNFSSPYPDSPSISENMVRAVGGGAVASWGPTGLGVAYGHDELNKGFFEAVFFGGVREFGPAALEGKLRLAAANHSLEQIQEYTVIGDPALRLHSPPTDLQVEKQADFVEEIEPGDLVTFTLRFSNTGPAIAFEPVLTDLMPSLLVNPSVIYSSPEVLSQRAGITFSWTITNLWPQTGGEVVIRAEVAPDAEVPVRFFNEATITSTTPDLAPANNRARVGVGTESVYLPVILRNR